MPLCSNDIEPQQQENHTVEDMELSSQSCYWYRRRKIRIADRRQVTDDEIKRVDPGSILPPVIQGFSACDHEKCAYKDRTRSPDEQQIEEQCPE